MLLSQSARVRKCREEWSSFLGSAGLHQVLQFVRQGRLVGFVGQRGYRTQAVHNVFSFAEVHNVHCAANLVFHFLHKKENNIFILKNLLQ